MGRQQEYIPYITLKSNVAYSIWNGIYKRCYKQDNVYDGSFMCDLWRYVKDSFAEWWSSEYYECNADKYKNKVPKKVYDALLRFEIKPYIKD